MINNNTKAKPVVLNLTIWNINLFNLFLLQHSYVSIAKTKCYRCG